MELIRSFSQLTAKDVTLAGGKGASLGEMTKFGFPIPKGYVILSTAFDYFLDQAHLQAEIQAALDGVNPHELESVERASAKIQAFIKQAEMPKTLGEQIHSHWKKLGSKFVAVRSSATAEDSANAAWAGQLDTFLYTTESTLLENVQKCFASLFSPRAIVYRFEKKLEKTPISVGVVVQEMVASDVSGIAFSVHPVTEDYNQLIIEAGYGLGEAIVSGQITPDSFVVDKKEMKIIENYVSEQERKIVHAAAGGVEWQEVPASKRELQKMTNEQILKMSELILKIEKHYGFPVDIEWAIMKGKMYILQSRPITTLSK